MLAVPRTGGLAVPLPLRGDRILRYVNAFCPRCHRAGGDPREVRRLAGWLAELNGRVYLDRGCPDHGMIRTLYEEDAAILAYLEEWTGPATRPAPDVAGNFDPIPGAYLRGLPELHTRHTAMLVVDVTEACNLNCPTCYADASPERRGVVPVADVLANVDRRIAREDGHLDVLVLSGGEPTLHPELRELLAELAARPIARIVVDTNGLLVARDGAVLDLLAEHRERIEVQLQYDGASAEAHRYHRGEDLRPFKELAVRRLSEYEIFTTLVMTAALGVNHEEIGDVVRLALDTPYVGGVEIRPRCGSGRSAAIDPMNRLTHTGVLKRLGPQTGGLVTWQDLTALPGAHPHCGSVGYLLRDEGGRWRSLAALAGHRRLKEYLGVVPDAAATADLPQEARPAVRQALLTLLAERASPCDPAIGELWRTVAAACGLDVFAGTAAQPAALPAALPDVPSAVAPGHRRVRRLLGEGVVRIAVRPFMDIATMVEERLVQCGVHVGTRGRQDQCAPFCAVQAWPALARQRLPVAAGEARDLPERNVGQTGA